ncbi:hypothetical protein EUGRSUZ_H04922 [Eucalyptus grandis]|uniref:non-specific serine/threonine protein kinase n=2 Tax=Eucalyptus grandis TaxID=71139 RepID=A0A059B7R0_EUCGR|nr:hypothetical protein EUGRSUZ_H04922 [Eucalyptus grandis]
MLDSGNFVIYNNPSNVIWQSFDSPTDTLAVGQHVLNYKELVSSESPVDHSSGRFHVVMQGDRYLVAYDVNSTNADTDAYWSTNALTESNGLCGFNSYCTIEQPVCRCFPGTDYVDSTNQSSGCERNFKEEWCKDAKENLSSFTFKSIDHLYWQDPPYFQVTMEVADCNMSCLEDCDYEVALYDFDQGTCTKQKLPLMYAWTVPEKSFRAFFKVGVGLTTVFTKRNLLLRPFSYKEMKRATNGFKEELGKGSFGAFYKGTLYRGKRVVAVKRLEKLLNEGEREFHAEMRVIGATNHRHLVRLLGFCAEASKRLLVYDYMSNGSLADLLFRSERCPDWNERMRIALETARGILYLHEECDTPIIHCDIKPQNILMDDFWAVKISDFGLAKLLMPDQTRTFTVIRGTRGYMAPEWHKGTPISVKADVYSYGIILLEIVFCCRHIDVYASTPEAIDGELDKLVLGEEVNKWLLEKLVKVSLWCIQDEPALRPSMKSVVMMLDGTTEISVSPCPTTTATV